ncbi:unnamed protein product, partial [Dicrocoelium dendriticum]
MNGWLVGVVTNSRTDRSHSRTSHLTVQNPVDSFRIIRRRSTSRPLHFVEVSAIRML